MKKIHYLFYVFFFISGATALIYEVIWARILQLTFGSTVYAITTVLTAFMAGLSIGSYFMGRYAERKKSPLLIYGFLEAGIGIYALITPFLLDLTDTIYLLYYHSIWQQQQLLFVVRFLHSFIVLLIPTIFMGATLPVLSKYLISRFENFGKTLSLLYAVNTFGAMLGTAFIGFYALPEIGMLQSNYLAASLNICVGIASLIIWKTQKGQNIIALEKENAHTEVQAMSTGREEFVDKKKAKNIILYIKILLLVSGYAAMAYELLWTRTLELYINSTTYSFSIILVTYLFGIALGSLINSVILKGRFNKIMHLSLLQLIIGIFAFCGFPLFSFIPRLVLIVWQIAPGSYVYNDLAKLICCMIIMLIPTICMGMTFPIAAEIYSASKKQISRDIGTAYAYTTWGNILGSFITGIFMVALLGIQNNIRICILMNAILAIAGFIVFYEEKVRLAYAVTIISSLLIVIVLGYPAWSPYILDSGVFVSQNTYKTSALLNELVRDMKIVYYKEGLNALITVRNSGDGLNLRTNGKTDASTNMIDMHSQLMSGYLPLLIKPDAKNSLIIGLGSGITAGAIKQSPYLQNIDCAEIEKSVVEAARFFKYYNKDFLNDKRVHVYIEDGKSLLKSATTKYDIISLHLSNPWIAGIANLFTSEAYTLMKSKLNDDGILVQWFHTYRVSPEILKMVIRTFTGVFSYSQIWTDGPSIFLVGADHPIPGFNEKFFAIVDSSPTIKMDLRNYFGSENGKSLLAYYVAENERIKEFAGPGKIHTDNQPLLEFALPKVYYFDFLENWNYMNLIKFRDKEDWMHKYLNIGNSDYEYYILASAKNRQGFSQEALDLVEKGLLLNDKSPYLLALKAYIIGPQNPSLSMELFEKAISIDPNIAEIHYQYAVLLMNRFSPESSLRSYQKAEELGCSRKEFWLDYASAFMKNSQYQQAEEALQKGLPYSEDLKYKFLEEIGNARLAMKDMQGALDYYKKIANENPYYSIIYARAADIYYAIGMYGESEKFLLKAIDTEPSRYTFYLKLAAVEKILSKENSAKDALMKAYLLTDKKLEIYETATSLGIVFP